MLGSLIGFCASMSVVFSFVSVEFIKGEETNSWVLLFSTGMTLLYWTLIFMQRIMDTEAKKTQQNKARGIDPSQLGRNQLTDMRSEGESRI